MSAEHLYKLNSNCKCHNFFKKILKRGVIISYPHHAFDNKFPCKKYYNHQ